MTAGILRAFEEANKNAPLLQRKFKMRYEYELVSRESIDALFKGNRRKVGRTFTLNILIRVATFIYLQLVSMRTRALVYAGHWCGDLCGEGGYSFLKKIDGKWTDIPWPGEWSHWTS